jgi:hypothetical protein
LDCGVFSTAFLLLNGPGNLNLYWPTSTVSYNLESTSNPNMIWSTVTNPVATNGGNNSVSINPAGANGFFRLAE